MNRKELGQWLGERATATLALGEIAEVLHVVIDASRRSLVLANAEELRELRFAIAVLRDVFSSDDDLRAWVRAPHAGLDGDAPADLLAGSRVREFADLAVDEWNRPRPHANILVQALAAPHAFLR
jgi:hypothetical protein